MSTCGWSVSRPGRSCFGLGSILGLFRLDLGPIWDRVAVMQAMGDPAFSTELPPRHPQGVVPMTAGPEAVWSSPPTKLGGEDVEFKFVVLGSDKAARTCACDYQMRLHLVHSSDA